MEHKNYNNEYSKIAYRSPYLPLKYPNRTPTLAGIRRSIPRPPLDPLIGPLLCYEI